MKMLSSKHLMSCSSSSPRGRRIVQAVCYTKAEKEAEFEPWLKLDVKDGLLVKM